MAKKAPEKSPAYQWYPKDILTDKRVLRMNLETEAVYRRLLDYAWLENGLDNDMELLASYAKMNDQVEKFMIFWKKIKPCFVLVKNKWRSPRQDKERVKQKAFSKKQKHAANRRWHPENDAKTHAPASPRHSHAGNAFQSSSSISSSKTNQLDVLNFSNEQITELRRRIAKKMGHLMLSEANEQEWKHFCLRIEKFVKRKKIERPYEYALTSIENLKAPVLK